MPRQADRYAVVRCVSAHPDDHSGLANFTRASEQDWLAVEAPLELRIAGEPFVTTMRTPGHDRDLLLGWLYHEGLLRNPSDVSGLAPCESATSESRGNVYELVAAAAMQARLRERDTSLSARTIQSSCGICGRQTIADLLARATPQRGAEPWSEQIIYSLLTRCSETQPLFHQTGCTHAASLGTRDGNILATREDVGRHNAVDKLTGWLFRTNQLPVAGDRALVVSSRASLEIVHKAVVSGFSAVFSLSAPTSLAVELAQSAGVVLAGFFRAGKFNVYTHHSRVTGASP
jgi:FdhD protein